MAPFSTRREGKDLDHSNTLLEIIHYKHMYRFTNFIRLFMYVFIYFISWVVYIAIT